MTDIGAWLAALGLERFTELFEANVIDAATLPELTNDGPPRTLDLPLGARKKLLDAIAALESGGAS